MKTKTATRAKLLKIEIGRWVPPKHVERQVLVSAKVLQELRALGRIERRFGAFSKRARDAAFALSAPAWKILCDADGSRPRGWPLLSTTRRRARA